MVPKKNAFISNLIKTSLDTGLSLLYMCFVCMLILWIDASATEVPIPGVVGNILGLVVDYMNHHQGTEPPIIEKPLRSKVMKDVCKDAWDAEFIDKIGDDRQKLYDLILVCVVLTSFDSFVPSSPKFTCLVFAGGQLLGCQGVWFFLWIVSVSNYVHACFDLFLLINVGSAALGLCKGGEFDQGPTPGEDQGDSEQGHYSPAWRPQG